MKAFFLKSSFKYNAPSFFAALKNFLATTPYVLCQAKSANPKYTKIDPMMHPATEEEYNLLASQLNKDIL